MRKNYVVCLCVLLLCGVTSSAFAAKKNSRKEIRDSLKKTEVDIRYLREKCNHWSIAAHVGVGFLDGDQSQKYNHIFPRTFAKCSFGVDVEYTFNPIFGLYLEYMRNPYAGKGSYEYYFKANGGYNYLQKTPIEFKGLSHTVNVGLSVNMLNLFYRYRKQVVGLYVNTGLGMAFYETTAYEPGTTDVMDKILNGAHIAPSFKNGRCMVIPVGFTLEYNPTRYLAIVWNSQYRLHTKDNWDCMQKAQNNDNFLYTGLGLRWKINSVKYKERKHVRDMCAGEFEKEMGVAMVAANALTINNITNKIDTLADRVDKIEPQVNELYNESQRIIPDSDLDGVPDTRDREPNTPEGSFVNYYGEALTAEEIQKILGDSGDNMPAIYFELGSSSLNAQSAVVFADIARKMYKDKNLKLELRGYCDYVGSEAFNQGLSVRRAETVRNELVAKYGIDAKRITVIGMGRIQGPTDNFLPNRRCDFLLKKK